MASMTLRVYRPFCVKTWISSSLAWRAASAIRTVSSALPSCISSRPSSERGCRHLAGAQVFFLFLIVELAFFLAARTTLALAAAGLPLAATVAASFAIALLVLFSVDRGLGRHVLEREELIEGGIESLLSSAVFGSTKDSEFFKKSRSR